MNKPKFAVITVCYNSENTIKRTIGSVIGQQYDYWHYYIIDGMSKDNTLQICNEYKEKYPDRITIISEKDSGIYDAMNKGLCIAQGDIIAIINSDDWYEDKAFENVADIYEKSNNEQVIIYAMCNKYRKGKLAITGLMHPCILNDEMMYHPSIFVSHAVYKTIGGFDLNYKIAADYEFLLRCLQNKVQFMPLYEVTTNFADGGISDSAKSYFDLIKIKRTYGLITYSQYCGRFIKGIAMVIAEALKKIGL